MMRQTMGACALAAALLGASPAASAGGTNDALVTFDAGAEGWSLNGWDTTTATGGNPGARLWWADFVDNFTMAARTSTHPAFVGDYTLKGPVTLGIDWQVSYIRFFGSPVPRELVVILYDDDTFAGAPAGAVWKSLGVLDGNGMPWTAFETSVPDVHSAKLPPGWRGAGAEDPKTFEPILPPGRTWTNVLQGIDRIEFTTGVPGFFYGFTNFDLSIDNVRIEPAAASAYCFGNDASCPCANGGAPGAGCDNAQATGGVELDVSPFSPDGSGGGTATLVGSGFPPATTPTVVAIRSPNEAVPPVPFGDGLLCIGTAGLARVGSTLASGGASSIALNHGAGAGDFFYQLWYRNNPATFCQPEAYNLSNGYRLVW
jgi:hypothetical protein